MGRLFSYYTTVRSQAAYFIRGRAHRASERVAQALGLPLFNRDLPNIKSIGRAGLNIIDVRRIKIMDAGQRVLFTKSRDHGSGYELVRIRVPVKYQGRPVGAAVLFFSRGEVYEAGRALISMMVKHSFRSHAVPDRPDRTLSSMHAEVYHQLTACNASRI